MAKKLASRAAQWPLTASFNFNFNDWVIDSVDLTKKTFGSTVANSVDPTEAGLTGPVANTITFDCIPLPPGAVITGGEIIQEVAGVGPTAFTLSLGIAGALTGLANAVSLLSAANTRTALALTTVLASNAAGNNVRATVAYTVANATAGKVRINLQYIIDGKQNENTIS
jgi:hypothetical protein